MNKGRRTYYEMVIAIILQAIMYSAVGAIITRQYVLFPLSILLGSGIAIALLSHMLKSIQIALDLAEEDTAKRYGQRQAVLRLLLMGLALCVAFYYDGYVNPWGVLLGVFSLKLSAYMQPSVHSFIKSFFMKRREKGK